jgi:hypothetical protein
VSAPVNPDEQPASQGGAVPQAAAGGAPPAPTPIPPAGAGIPAPTPIPPGGPEAPGPFAPPAAPVKKKRTGLIVGIIIAVLVVCGGVIGGGAALVNKGKTATINAKAGDCLSGDDVTGTSAQKVQTKIVGCDTADAKYKVLGVVADKDQAALNDQSLCEPFTGAEKILWEGVAGEKGKILCLSSAK